MSAAPVLPVHHRVAWIGHAVVVLAVGTAGCDTPTEPAEPPPVAPPACQAVTTFGNGTVCSAKDPTLAACGSAKRRVCASGWLCFDAPEFAACACTTDADCDRRAAYINAARTAARKAPLAARCDGFRCIGPP
ncbi:MAG: hypothetical protein EXR79_15615 [Myxococcales bacterium]|nr:hypothetical protein [Myxococcales bacterium]